MAAAEQLLTRADLKAWLTVTETTFDTMFDALIDAMSTFVLNELNITKFTSASYTESYSGVGNPRLFMRQRPVTAITSLTIDGQTIPASADGIAAGYVFDDNTIMLIGYCFSTGFQNVRVTYTAGRAGVPTDVAQMAKDLCAAKWKRRGRIGENTKNLQTMQVSFTTKDLDPWMVQVLDNYRNVCYS
jgi:hypothetical protein